MRDEHFLLDITEVRDAGRVCVLLHGELDLDELEFIDMSGLRVLLEASEEASHDGWSLAITRGSAPVRRLIGLVALEGHLPLDGRAR